jgi:hypothetical protein
MSFKAGKYTPKSGNVRDSSHSPAKSVGYGESGRWRMEDAIDHGAAAEPG